MLSRVFARRFALGLAGTALLVPSSVAAAQTIPAAATTTVPSSTQGTPVVTSVNAVPFYDSATLGGHSVDVGGATLTPQTLACSTSTVSGYQTEKCVNPSSTVIYASGQTLSGGSFSGHLEVTINGSLLENLPPSGGNVTFGANAWNIGGSFPNDTYCVILWRLISGSNYEGMGNVCETL